MLVINLRDGSTRKYQSNEFTDYEYLKQVFVVLKNDQWIGIYNMEDVISVEYWDWND